MARNKAAEKRQRRQVYAWVLTVLAIPLISSAIASLLEKNRVGVFILVALLLGGTALGYEIWVRRHRKLTASVEPPPDGDPLTYAAESLAVAVRATVLPELKQYGLLESREAALLIPLDWRLKRAPEKDAAALASWRRTGGTVEGLAEFFSALPSRTLVITGPKEAGKTAAAMLTTVSLLPADAAELPVPVLLPLTGWNPDKGMHDWLVSRLTQDYPWLLAADTFGDDAASRLIATRRVLPVLDGLDEVPVRDRGDLIRALNDPALDLPGVIITCREEEYDLAARAGRLDGAVVIELAAPTAAQACAYLRASAHEDAAKWEPICRELSDSPGSALARVLTSVLMLMLIAHAYQARDADPAELLELRAADEEEIERRLLAAFLPAVYPKARSTDSGIRSWPLEPAHRYLGHLATAMSRRQEFEIRWWELSKHARTPTRILAGLLGFGLVFTSVGLAAWVLGGTFLQERPARIFALAVGGTVGLALGLLCAIPPPPRPSETQLRKKRRLQSALLAGVPITLIGGALGTIAWGPQRGPLVGLIFGFPVGVLYGLAGPNDSARQISPEYLLRRDITVGIMFTLVYGIPCGILGTILAPSPLIGLTFGVTAGLSGGLLYGPFWIFAQDNRSGGAVAFVHLGLAILWLAPQGKLPWNVMRFLADAHKAGVLRQTAGVWRFRHQSLQASLLAPPAPLEVVRPNPRPDVQPAGVDAEAPQIDQ